MVDTRSARDEVLQPAGEAEEIDDDVLTSLTEDLGPRPDALERAGRGDEERGDEREAPFNLGLPPPRAIDLRRLWKLAGKKPDDTITAGLGPRVPVLLSHGVTAFPRPGRKPARVWGLGYTVELFDVDARTVDVQPTTELLDVVQVGSEATVDIGLDGSLEVPEGARVALDTIPGVNLTAAKVGASVNESAKLSISFTLSVPKVISGPGDGPGGAQWNLYAQDKRLEGHQALLQTILLPKGVKRLRLGVTGWAREAGIFGPKQWIFETATFDVDLER
jgi:hypothetical protein